MQRIKILSFSFAPLVIFQVFNQNFGRRFNLSNLVRFLSGTFMSYRFNKLTQTQQPLLKQLII